MKMIGKKYKAHKDNVIDLFNNYKAKRDGINDGIDTKFLEGRVESLKKGKFTLAVAGEVKAGKSTFINALLGADILPSDVLQASSAIVEIFKSETSFLKVRYADGTEENIYDDLETPDTNEANERLREICKIHDEYREIPTTLIDDNIIECDGTLEVNANLIAQLEKLSGETLTDKHSVIEKFISERTKNKIPIEIEFGYPLRWDFDELRIVDSPGVNATGGVQDVAFRFFEEANAILFIHPIKPIESESFRKFISTVITNRSKETLFLILTHAGLYSDNEIERLHIEATRLYKNVISENRILVVDSLLQLICNDFKNGLTQEEIENSSEQKEDILPKFEKRAKKEGTDLLSQLKRHSRFEEMFASIDEFSMKAPNLQLQEILEKIREGYEKQESLYTENTKILESKKISPQEFEKEITRISDSLEKYRLLTKHTTEDLKSNYSGRHSSWQKDIDELKIKYPELITGSNSIEEVRKNSRDALNAVQEKVDSFSKELTERLEKSLKETGNAFKKEFSISIPKVDLRALEEEAKENAYRQEDVYEDRDADGWDYLTFGISYIFREKRVKNGTKKVFDDNQFLEEYKRKCNEEFNNIINALPKKSKDVLELYLNLFSKEMDSVINDRQSALEDESKKKQSNEEIIVEIKELHRKKEDIQQGKSLCIEVLGDIK